MPTLTAGELRERIVFLASTRTDDRGFASETYSTVATVWAAVRPVGGSNENTQNRRAAKLALEISIRYRSDLTDEMRIVWRGKTFEIVAPLQIVPMEGRMTISALEDESLSLAVDHLTVSPSSFLLGSGQTQQLTATCFDENGNVITGLVLWSTSDPTIATVDATTGLVTGVASGICTITASCEGKTATATASLPLITDAFSRADNPASLGNTDTGQPWVQILDVWGVIGGTAYTSDLSAGGGQGAAVVSTLWPDAVLSCQIPAQRDAVGLVWRAIDNLNYFLFQRESGGTVLAVYKRVGSTSFTAVTSAGYTWNTADVLAVHVLGSTAIVTANGAPILSFTDSALVSATGYGLRSTDINNRFGPFRVARANVRLVVDADSITSGFELAPNNSWPSILCQRAGFELYSLINHATAGADIRVDMIGREATDASYRASGGPYVASLFACWAGTNDIIFGRTAAQIEADYWSVFDYHFTTGGLARNKMICATVIPRDATLNGVSQATFDAVAADLNARIRANYAAHCGWLCDVAADSHYSSPTAFTDSSIYLDRIHPNAPTGVGILANIWSPVVQNAAAA